MRIEAVAQYVHFFSVFDQTYHHKPKYYFTYQVRIDVDPEYLKENGGNFYECELTVSFIGINSLIYRDVIGK